MSHFSRLVLVAAIFFIALFLAELTTPRRPRVIAALGAGVLACLALMLIDGWLH